MFLKKKSAPETRFARLKDSSVTFSISNDEGGELTVFANRDQLNHIATAISGFLASTKSHPRKAGRAKRQVQPA
jgi:hypothetical protein